MAYPLHDCFQDYSSFSKHADMSMTKNMRFCFFFIDVYLISWSFDYRHVGGDGRAHKESPSAVDLLATVCR